RGERGGPIPRPVALTPALPYRAGASHRERESERRGVGGPFPRLLLLVRQVHYERRRGEVGRAAEADEGIDGAGEGGRAAAGVGGIATTLTLVLEEDDSDARAGDLLQRTEGFEGVAGLVLHITAQAGPLREGVDDENASAAGTALLAGDGGDGGPL